MKKLEWTSDQFGSLEAKSAFGFQYQILEEQRQKGRYLIQMRIPGTDYFLKDESYYTQDYAKELIQAIEDKMAGIR